MNTQRQSIANPPKRKRPPFMAASILSAIPTADAEFSNMVLKNVTSPRHGAKGGCLPENLIALVGMDTQTNEGASDSASPQKKETNKCLKN